VRQFNAIRRNGSPVITPIIKKWANLHMIMYKGLVTNTTVLQNVHL